jgi:predicted lipid-binding transport protein (Tim44 family)
MKSFSLLVACLMFAFTLGAGDAEAAKRLGAGKSSGMQRQVTAPDKAPTATPTQAARADSAAPSAPTAAAQQAKPRPSWMGPVAGLAAGLGLAALASHFGFGEELASMLMMGLIALAVVLAFAFFMRRRAAAPEAALAGAGSLQYAGTEADGAAPAARTSEMSLPSSGDAAASANIPADFDVAGFVRNAKVHFIRLQAANDAGNMDDIRAFTTPEMFAELKLNLAEPSAPQETDVVAVDADVLEVAEESSRYVASVRFTGLVRENKNSPAEPFDEIWHLVKPREGSSGWLLAGIQQRH